MYNQLNVMLKWHVCNFYQYLWMRISIALFIAWHLLQKWKYIISVKSHILASLTFKVSSISLLLSLDFRIITATRATKKWLINFSIIDQQQQERLYVYGSRSGEKKAALEKLKNNRHECNQRKKISLVTCVCTAWNIVSEVEFIRNVSFRSFFCHERRQKKNWGEQ